MDWRKIGSGIKTTYMPQISHNKEVDYVVWKI